MEPSIPSVTIDGLHLAFAFGGFAVGLGIGYLYGWLHFGDCDAEEGDEE